jgi:hypothetical protein
MTDDDARRHLSDEQRKLYDEAIRESFKFRAMMGVGTKDLIGILRELAEARQTLEVAKDDIVKLADQQAMHDDFYLSGLAAINAALAPPPPEGKDE